MANRWPMISIAEANSISLGETQPLPAIEVPLSEAYGMIIAEDVTAPEPQPPFRASIKDGYAVVAADGPGEYDVAAEVRAGDKELSVKPGTVAYITTGAPVPAGADAVVQVEDTADATQPGGPRRVRITRAAKPGEDIRPVGSDVALGQVVLSAGDRLGPAEIGILASVGASRVKVHRQPLVAVLSTGDELAEVDTPPGALPYGAIRDSNRATLLAAAAEARVRSLDLGIARDDPGGLASRLDAAIAANADVLVTSGGVSMGDRDLVKPLLESRGKIFFGRVLMKPGKPLTFAVVPKAEGKGNLLVFGLPGNPVSSVATWLLVVVPVLRKLSGMREPALRRVHVRTTAPLRLDKDRPEYHRATARWDPIIGALVADSTGGQISSRLLSCRSANLLLELPRAEGTLPAGTVVSALVTGDLGLGDGISAPFLAPAPPPPAAPAAAATSAAAGGAAGKAKPVIGVLTVSDRASAGIYEDLSGPAIVSVLKEYLTCEAEFVTKCIPDERSLIAATLREMAAAGASLVCTTGGTGPALRDVTPEAMEDVCDKMIPGFGEEMRRASLKDVPTAILSRQTAGVLGRTLILNIPGKPAAVRTCLDAVFPAIPYCVDLIGGAYLEGKGVFRPKPK